MAERTSFEERLAQVRWALAGRRLLWFGIRGEDAQSLLDVPEFAGSFAITAPLRSLGIPESMNVALERGLGFRMDLDRYDLDEDASEAALTFRSALLRAVSQQPCVLLTYRPNGFVSSLAFACAPTLSVAGMLKDRQRGFEFKPWVETSVRQQGIPVVDWTYVPDSDRGRAKRLLRKEGPLVLRVSRASGGVGMVVVRTDDDIDLHWPSQADSFVAAAPYLEGTISVNFSGCVFRNGSVTLHPLSLQLVGLASCTSLPFGYCGNDFAAAPSLPLSVIDTLERMGATVGAWLAAERYVGAFGIDAIVNGDAVLFCEVNARLQGSSSCSAAVARNRSLPGIVLDHLGALLGIDACPQPSLAAYFDARPVAHAVVHNISDHGMRMRSAVDAPSWGATPVQIAELVPVAPGGVLGRLIFSRAITATGVGLDDDAEAAVKALRTAYEPDARWSPE